jgi:hypothetical protein
MFITHSVAFDPLRPAEVETMRRLARAERDFAVAAKRASRLTFLAATLTGRLDPEAALGLRVSEADAIVALARTPARTKSPFGNYGWASLRIINPPIAISIMASETSILAS